MRKQTWKNRIKDSCIEAGTYRECFDAIIDTLAGILELRDNAEEKFIENGGNTIIQHTNKGGSTNTVKNPALVVLMDCNAQALAYWRDLGLTPAGLKRINEAALKADERKESVLEEALKTLSA